MDEKSIKGLKFAFAESAPSWEEMFDMTGKVAIITGGTSGLGFALANRMAQAGASVVITGRNDEKGAECEAYFRGKGWEVSYFKADVSKVADCHAVAAFAVEKYGRLDILVPVAAVWDFGAIVDISEDTYDRIVDTNTKGQYFMIQAAARQMIKCGNGGVITMCSSITRTGMGDSFFVNLDSAYCTSKSALLGLCVSLARELKVHGIRVNMVTPGAQITEGLMSNGHAAMAKYGAKYVEVSGQSQQWCPVPVSKTPDEVARVIFAMCTDFSAFMYGVNVDVDGGSLFCFTREPFSYTLEGCVPGPQID